MKNRSTQVELQSIGEIIGDIKNPPTRRMPTGKKRGRPRKEVSNVRKLFHENAGLKEDLLFSLRRAVRGECVGEMEPLNGKVWCELITLLIKNNIVSISDSKSKTVDEEDSSILWDTLGLN